MSLRLRPRELVTARLAHAYLRGVARTSTYVVVDADGDAIDLAVLADTVAGYGEPLIATYWIDNALPLATLSFAQPGLVTFARRFRFLIDDTFGGRVSAYAIANAGGQFAMLALPGDPLRLQQVSAIIAARGSCIFPVDGGGPYRRVGTGIVGLATALRAAIVPLAVRASRGFTLPHRSRLQVPLPGGRIAVAVGRPIAARKSDLRRETAVAVERALADVDQMARAVAD